MDIRMRPQNDFVLHAGWDELHSLTMHWKSDMEFYRDELSFLNNLVGKYFIWMVSDENLNKVQALTNKLLETDGKLQVITSKIGDHLHHLKSLVNNTSSGDEKKFRDEHAKLEDDLLVFVKSLKKLKKDIFSITEHVMESEKLRHLLTP